MPAISVIMPVYNAHEFLRESMDSLVNQTLRDIEIICVDDGSTDDSLAILEEYARADGRVRVIAQPNGGAGKARNTGMQYASGEYLSIVDCDDFFEPDMLEKSYQVAKEKDLDIVVFDCDMYDHITGAYHSGTRSIHRELLPAKDVFCAEDVPRDVFKLFVGWSWDKLFRTRFVKAQGMLFQEQRSTNDMLFVFNGLLRAKRISVMDGVYAHHRRGVESISVTREKSWMCFYDALKALREEMYKLGCYERFEQDFKNYCLHFSLWNLNTLKEPTHTMLYNKLREEWLAEMGLLEHSADYFYNAHEYRLFRSICEHPAGWEEKRMALENPDLGILERLRGTLEVYGLKYTLMKILNKLVFLLTGKELLC